jgi:hypothetical protein
MHASKVQPFVFARGTPLPIYTGYTIPTKTYPLICREVSASRSARLSASLQGINLMIDMRASERDAGRQL